MRSGTAARAAASTIAVCGVVILGPAVAGMSSSRSWGIGGLVALAVATLLAPASLHAMSASRRPRGVTGAAALPLVGRAASLVVACAGLGLAVTGVLAIRTRLHESWTDPVDALPPLAGLLLLAGAGWLAWAWPPDRPAGHAAAADPARPLDGVGTTRAGLPPAGLAGVLVAVVLVAAVTAGAVTVVPALAIDASTAAPGTAPARISRVGAGPLSEVWSRTFEYAEGAIAGARGPLLLVGDGVVARDGTTGADLWHYRVPGIHVQVAAGRGGRTVVLRVLGEGRPRSQATRILVLDGASGQVQVDRPVAPGHDERWTDDATADEILVGSVAVVTEAMGYQVSRSLTDGRLLWQRDTNAEFCDTHRRVAMVHDVLVQAFTCRGDDGTTTGYVIGTDPTTGRTRWQRTTRAGTIADPVLSVASDGSAVAVTLLATAEADPAATAGRGWAVVPGSTALWLLDPVTGTVLHSADPRKAETIRALGAGWWMTGPWSVVRPGAPIEYVLGSAAGPTRTVPTAEGECLAARNVVLAGGWICQTMGDTRPTGYRVVPSEPAAPVAPEVSGDAWLDDMPGALIAWTSTGYRVTALRWS
jgi:hypothetical protein